MYSVRNGSVKTPQQCRARVACTVRMPIHVNVLYPIEGNSMKKSTR